MDTQHSNAYGAEDSAAINPKTLTIVQAGVYFAGFCCAALSAPTLYNLARTAHISSQLSYLLPGSLDGYAVTSMILGNAVPKEHPVRKKADANTRQALSLTVGANAVYHLLVLAGKYIPAWIPIVLLISIISLPPYILHRLIHLLSMVRKAELQSGAGSGNGKSHPDRQRGSRKSTGSAAARHMAAEPGPEAEPETVGTAEVPPAAPSALPEEAASTRALPRQRRPESRPASAAESRTLEADEEEAGEPEGGKVVPIGSKQQQRALLAVPLWNDFKRKHGGAVPDAPTLARLVIAAYPGTTLPESDRGLRYFRQAVMALADAPSGGTAGSGRPEEVEPEPATATA